MYLPVSFSLSLYDVYFHGKNLLYHKIRGFDKPDFGYLTLAVTVRSGKEAVIAPQNFP